jgi:hypothetical protein
MAHTSQPLPQPIFSEPVFGEDRLLNDPRVFLTTHPSDDPQYQQVKDLLTKSVVGFESSRVGPSDVFTLESAMGPHGTAFVQRLKQAGRTVFHAVGDTGASNVRKYRSEIRVSDQMADDSHTAATEDRPAFLYHLGDVIYSFGEAEYYYDQFYEAFRNYPGPIFAIPGNHDSFVIPGTPATKTPLTTFMRNFCAAKPVVTEEARSLHRTAMTQPGVYFALDCPFVRIIGLFSNALEDPGLISSEGGKWRGVPDVQLDYLKAQLRRVREEKYPGAVLLATHHPAFSYAPEKDTAGTGGNHGSSTPMLAQIDEICKSEGVYPHAFLSGHAHNYQRYTRTVRFGGKDFDVPFVVCGSGGHNVNRLVKPSRGEPAREPDYGADVGYLDKKPAIETDGLLLEKYEDINYGYLRVSVDAQQLRIGFHGVASGTLPQSRVDLVTVQLADHTMVSN